jgi:antibiotic biosynthesis monooxygenase (ABM) superfamily enzyme
VELSDKILKWGYPRTITARFGLIWFSGFRGKDLNVIFYQNMPNLHNWYTSAERKYFIENPGIYVKLLIAM